jgi:hypothetical protein
MYEFNVPIQHHIDLTGSDFAELFPLAVGILGDEAALVAQASLPDAGLELRLVPSDVIALRQPRRTITPEAIHEQAIYPNPGSTILGH